MGTATMRIDDGATAQIAEEESVGGKAVEPTRSGSADDVTASDPGDKVTHDTTLSDIEAAADGARIVVAAVLRVRKDDPDVDDLVHEAVRRAIEHRDRLHEGAPVRPWLVGIARHVALDARRARQRQRARAGGDAHERDVPDVAPSPLELTEKRRLLRDLRAHLEQLAEGPRRALLLAHLEGRDYQSIAEELQVPLGTVATWIARGRRHLRARLEEAAAPPASSARPHRMGGPHV